MFWQFALVFVLGAIVGGIIAGFVAYRKGRKDEYKRWSHSRMARL